MPRIFHRAVLLLATVVAASLVVLPAMARTHATTVTVTAVDLKFKLSTKTVKAGAVTFKVTNRGHVAHNFKIAGKKTPLLQPGKSATLKVTLKKGNNPYLCTVPGHAAAGMKGIVKGI
jgi:nitrite reductase (NO-forming)